MSNQTAKFFKVRSLCGRKWNLRLVITDDRNHVVFIRETSNGKYARPTLTDVAHQAGFAVTAAN